MAAAPPPFDLAAPLPVGRVVLEASAGTGKTYTLTNLAVRHVVERGVLPEKLLVVTFTRAAANELRDRTRGALTSALTVLVDGVPAADHQWTSILLDCGRVERAARVERARDALARFDDATITTIHGFCQQALAQAGLRTGTDRDAVLVESVDDLVREVCRDVLVDVLVVDPSRLSPLKKNGAADKTPKQVENQLVATINALLANPGATTVPDARCTHPLAVRWVEVVERARREVRARQEARQQIGYDRLVTDLRDALVDPVHGEHLAQLLAERYEVVLVDEFQDTDRTQWTIFETAFPGRTVVTVGDPKQAIYRFRGADVHAYLAAVESHAPFALPVNHRSDEQLLSGLEHLFDGATLGDPRIGFAPVQPARGAPVNALDAGPAVQLRMVPYDDSLKAPRSPTMAMPLVRQVVLADLTTRIVGMLQSEHVSDPTDGRRRVRPGDMAVLVPTHGEAANVADALRRAKVPAVRTRTGSVLDTAAALQWRLLLAALARPHHAPTVKAAGLSCFFGVDPATLTGAPEEASVSALQEQCAIHADRMRKAGVAAAYDALRATKEFVRSVITREGGDRELADLDHIAELLAARTHRENTEPAQVLHLLEEMILDRNERSDETMRRIESDTSAVQITTIHSAKGLEYPIVFVPFAFKCRNNVDRPYTFVEGDERMIDVASLVDWDDGTLNARDRHRLATDAVDGDGLRLLYVALTRAKHRLEVWWACSFRWGSSPLARLLLDRDGTGPVRNVDVPDWEDLGHDEVEQRIRDLVAASGGTIALTELPPTVRPAIWTPGNVDVLPPLATAATHGRATIADESWRRWSFTSLARRMADADAAHDAVAVEAPVAGGSDEFVVESTPDDTTSSAPDVEGFVDLVGGTRLGTFVHAVLEKVDFAATDLARALRDEISDRARREALQVDEDVLVEGLVTALGSSLGPELGSRALRDIRPADRLNELSFDLPLARTRTAAADIAGVLLDTLPASDVLRPSLTTIADGLARVDIAGWMYGSIDAVLRIRGDAERFVVVDYKTNRLHAPGDTDPLRAYAADRLADAMAAHHYPLQAALYLVALHRYLRWRLGHRYDPDTHLGGAAYLFLRGMVNGGGVFTWRPPVTAIDALDGLLARGRAA